MFSIQMLAGYRLAGMPLLFAGLLSTFGSGLGSGSAFTGLEQADIQKSAAQFAAACSPGVYYWNRQRWTELQHVAISEVKRKYRWAFLPFSAPWNVYTLRGSDGQSKIVDTSPLFLIKQATPPSPLLGSPRDIVLVRLNKKDGHREVQASTGTTIFNSGTGFPKETLIDMRITPISNNSYIVEPIKNLARGEYLLTFGTGKEGGFDFEMLPARTP